METYFELFELPVSLVLDSKVLERKFQALQRQVHPDMYATKTEKEQQIAIARSAAASEAYQTLKVCWGKRKDKTFLCSFVSS